MEKIMIFGIGDLAKELYYYIKQQYEVVGFIVDDEYSCNQDNIYNIKIYKKSEIKVKNEYPVIIAIGYKDMRFRKNIFLKLKDEGFKFINFIHKSVLYEKDLLIGDNNIIFPGVIIEPGVQIGSNNIIWSKNLICHDSEIGNHNFIAADSLVGGFTKILDNNFIGFNSTIIQRIVINKEVLIGAKSLVNKNPNDYTKNYGIPSKEISNHKNKGMKIE